MLNKHTTLFKSQTEIIKKKIEKFSPFDFIEDIIMPGAVQQVDKGR